MSDAKILLPGQSPTTDQVIVPQAGLYVPDHIIEERDEQRAAEAERKKQEQARNDIIRKAQEQLTALAADVKAGKPLTAGERSEANWLMKVATGEGNRRVRRMHKKRLGLLESQAPLTRYVKSKADVEAEKELQEKLRDGRGCI